MTRSERVVDKIQQTKGKLFHVTFVKRSKDEIRLMVARTDVDKYKKGGVQPYNPADKGLYTVFDNTILQYRSIPLEGVLKFKCGDEVLYPYTQEVYEAFLEKESMCRELLNQLIATIADDVYVETIEKEEANSNERTA